MWSNLQCHKGIARMQMNLNDPQEIRHEAGNKMQINVKHMKKKNYKNNFAI